jgi:hypothetical protein
MTDKKLIRLWIASLCACALTALSYPAFSATTLIPVHNGTFTGSGAAAWNYKAAAGYNPAFDPVSRKYTATSLVRIGGSTITIPTKYPLLPTAAALAKTAIRTTPLLLAGTLALDWLNDNDVFYDPVDGFYTVDSSNTYPDGVTYSQPSPPGTRWYKNPNQTYVQISYGNCYGASSLCSMEQAAIDYAKSFFGSASAGSHISDLANTWATTGCNTHSSNKYRCGITVQRTNGTSATGYLVDVTKTANPAPQETRIPVTDNDIDALPDPIPVIGPELPNADYMPQGAPVGTPEFDEGEYPVGNPYKDPDGSTRQDYANITNNYNKIGRAHV